MFRNLYQVLYNADGAEFGNDTVDGQSVDDNGLSGDEELEAAIKSLLASENDNEDDSEDTSDEEDSTEDDEDDSTEDEEDVEEQEEEQEEETVEETKGKKREQSREENAKFAAQRRQKELDAKVQAEVERLRQQSPEFQLAKQLAERSGLTPEAMLEQIRDAQLKEQADKSGIPLEVLKEREADRQKLADMEQQMNQLRFQNWQNKIQTDTEKLKSQYSFLTDEDFSQATDYILNTVGNVDLPLEDAVYAVHGKKIIENLANAKVQDKLADDSGRRRKTPPSPNNGKPSKVISLSAEEKYVAKQMGLSYEDYLKYKQ